MINKYDIIDMNIYNFKKISFLMKMLLHAKIVLILNYITKFIQNILMIENKSQLFKIFAQRIEQFLCISLLKINVIFFDISTANSLTIENFIQTKTIEL